MHAPRARSALTAPRPFTPRSLAPLSRHLAATAKAAPAGSAYDVLGVDRTIDGESLKQIYKSLAREWHPDRHQGAAREKAEERFQEISEAFQTLSNPVSRKMYDDEIDAAKTKEAAAAAAKRFRAATWNTEVPDVRARLRNAKKEEAGFPPHIIAGTLLFVTGNFIMVLNWLGG